MNVERINTTPSKPEFEPVTFQITITSREEFDNLLRLVAVSNSRLADTANFVDTFSGSSPATSFAMNGITVPILDLLLDVRRERGYGR